MVACVYPTAPSPRLHAQSNPWPAQAGGSETGTRFDDMEVRNSYAPRPATCAKWTSRRRAGGGGVAAPGLGRESRRPLVPGAGQAHPKGVALELVNPQSGLPLVLPLGDGTVGRLGLLRRVKGGGRLEDVLVPAPDRELARLVPG